METFLFYNKKKIQNTAEIFWSCEKNVICVEKKEMLLEQLISSQIINVFL